MIVIPKIAFFSYLPILRSDGAVLERFFYLHTSTRYCASHSETMKSCVPPGPGLTSQGINNGVACIMDEETTSRVQTPVCCKMFVQWSTTSPRMREKRRKKRCFFPPVLTKPEQQRPFELPGVVVSVSLRCIKHFLPR